MEQCYHKTNKYMTNYTRAERRRLKKQYDNGDTQIEYPDGSISFASRAPSPRERYLEGGTK